ncbi:hypothetical protein B0H21DRAFT_278463 [Amylocystis lapponica]|nr:hypothetical protein B0H21DRAFT_278463 [Amylocystis lapponica]
MPRAANGAAVMSKPIILWRRDAVLTSDEACTTITKYALAPPPTKPPYEPSTVPDTTPRTLSYVPSLAYFCIQQLIEHADQLHNLGQSRLAYQRPHSSKTYDILRALIPSYRHDSLLDHSQVDPRLWSVIIQIYTGLPANLRRYTLPLADPHLPLLQRIPSTPHFALLAVLELPGCPELTDETVVELRALHGLCALDASGTVLTTRGVRTLAKSLVFAEDEEELDGTMSRPRRGPWGLRILSLRDCVDVRSDILDCLTLFPLLSVVDLRGTRCKPLPSPFEPSTETTLYHPASISTSLAHFQRMYSASIALSSHPDPYVLHVKGLRYEKPRSQVPAGTWFPQTSLLPRRDVFQSVGPSTLAPRRPVPLNPYSGQAAYDPFHSYWDDRDEDEDERDDEDEDDESQSYESDGLEDDTESFHVGRHHHGASTYQQQNAIAATEARLHAEQQSVLHFYNSSPMLPPLSSLPKRRTSGPTTPKEWAYALPPVLSTPVANPLTLLRRPAPWSSLPAAPDVGVRTTPGTSCKRRRMDPVADGTPLPAEEARKSTLAMKSMLNMLGMVRKHVQSAAAEDIQGQPMSQAERPISRNPFARASLDAGAKASTSKPGRRARLPCPT